MTKQEIIDEIQSINSKLVEIYNTLLVENADGKQFDFVTSPRLADAVDVLEKWSRKIENLVYQK